MYTGKLPSTLIGWRRSTDRPITRDFRPGGPAWTTLLQRLDHFDAIQVLRNGPLRYTIVRIVTPMGQIQRCFVEFAGRRHWERSCRLRLPFLNIWCTVCRALGQNSLHREWIHRLRSTCWCIALARYYCYLSNYLIVCNVPNNDPMSFQYWCMIQLKVKFNKLLNG